MCSILMFIYDFALLRSWLLPTLIGAHRKQLKAKPPTCLDGILFCLISAGCFAVVISIETISYHIFLWLTFYTPATTHMLATEAHLFCFILSLVFIVFHAQIDTHAIKNS